MNERKLQILFSIINSYIMDGEPIGSKSLADEYDLNISPATIRNEMSSLEKMGLIEKAHTSSGRLPSDKGYRMFVDYILENEPSRGNRQDSPKITDLLDKRYHNATDIVETATKILAEITNLTAVSVTLKNEIKQIANMELVRLSDRQLLLIIVFDNGLITNDRIYLDYDISTDELIFINNVLHKKMVGTAINDVDHELKAVRDELLKEYQQLMEVVYDKLAGNTYGKLDREVQIEGLGNIFNFKEYDDLSRAKEFIKLFDSKDRVNKLIATDPYTDLNITIGYENDIDELKNNTIITSYFRVNDDVIGHIGVVGLTRLNYIDVISNIRMISDLLNK